MTKATPKKKSDVKAHRGFAHVPLRGRRRRRPPIQQPIGRQPISRPRGRPLTPAQKDAQKKLFSEAMRKQYEAAKRRRRQTQTLNTKGVSLEEIRRRQKEAIGRRRKPTGDPKPIRRRRTVTGTPAKQRVVKRK